MRLRRSRFLMSFLRRSRFLMSLVNGQWSQGEGRSTLPLFLLKFPFFDFPLHRFEPRDQKLSS